MKLSVSMLVTNPTAAVHYIYMTGTPYTQSGGLRYFAVTNASQSRNTDSGLQSTEFVESGQILMLKCSLGNFVPLRLC